MMVEYHSGEIYKKKACMAGHTTETTTVSLNAHATMSQDPLGKDESSSKLDLDLHGSSSEPAARVLPNQLM